MKPLKLVLRVVLTVLLVFVAVKVGVTLAPKLARAGVGQTGPATPSSMNAAKARAAQPDWGGARLSFPAAAPAEVIDSAKGAAEGDPANTRSYSGPEGGVLLTQKPGGDHALTMAVPSSDRPGRSAVLEVPSSRSFRRQLLPGPEDAEAPARDIPLYPKSRCRTQVGHGTACFVGFYLTPDSIEAVRSFYVRELSQLGWERVTAGSLGLLETFTKTNEDRMVVVQLRKQDPASTRIGVVAMSSGRPDRSERK
ncbi:MAG: hypothetical protein JSU73_05695 [candidate division WOR-3 bacterium]|nr:MAG: hypothetical protein JSU73_05695 [candidate division WOR-3 bacterium]